METEPPSADSAETPETTPFAADIFAKQPFKGYRLTDILAADDRRAVFKAHDETMERPVAVKVMRPWPGREGIAEEFFSLAGSVARLRCPGAARGLDAGRSDGNLFMVYEFLPGESLRQKVERRQTGRLTEKESLRLARDVADVLHSLFELGNPHGNLKPSNIIVAEGGKPRLADIGFAWTLAWSDDEEAFRVFPDFLPPERLDGEINIDIRGDLYSLGAIWFRALLGRPVFQGGTPEETVRMHREEKAPALGTIDPKVSAATSQLVRWLLEKDRDARPRTPKEFMRKLAEHPLLAECAT
ncbi:MAG: serine/threonine protein kinase [Planctomycetota bacterium]|jgi:serine/threonine-protein kinase|nr:serine/threonine protein kinase [Planctomycetota bacterium]